MTYAHPALTWLIKHDPEAALAVFHRMRDAYYHHGSDPQTSTRDPRERNADDAETHDAPEGEHTSETMSESVTDGPDEVRPEMLHEIKPNINAVMADLLRVRVIRHIDGAVRRHGGIDSVPVFTGDRARLAGMTFSFSHDIRRPEVGGTMISYTDADGRERLPEIVAEKPRGGKKPHRKNPERYLALPPALPSPLTATTLLRPMSGEPAIGDMYDPLPRLEPSAKDKAGRFGVEEARAVLQALGIDGSVPFERLPFPATKLPDAIARNSRFIGGLSGRCQTASTATFGNWEPAEPISTKSEAVFDEVAARGTLESIGIKLGYRGGYADRAGKKALLAAGRELVAANQNGRQKKVAA